MSTSRSASAALAARPANVRPTSATVSRGGAIAATKGGATSTATLLANLNAEMNRTRMAGAAAPSAAASTARSGSSTRGGADRPQSARTPSSSAYSAAVASNGGGGYGSQPRAARSGAPPPSSYSPPGAGTRGGPARAASASRGGSSAASSMASLRREHEGAAALMRELEGLGVGVGGGRMAGASTRLSASAGVGRAPISSHAASTQQQPPNEQEQGGSSTASASAEAARPAPSSMAFLQCGPQRAANPALMTVLGARPRRGEDEEAPLRHHQGEGEGQREEVHGRDGRHYSAAVGPINASLVHSASGSASHVSTHGSASAQPLVPSKPTMARPPSAADGPLSSSMGRRPSATTAAAPSDAHSAPHRSTTNTSSVREANNNNNSNNTSSTARPSAAPVAVTSAAIPRRSSAEGVAASTLSAPLGTASLAAAHPSAVASRALGSKSAAASSSVASTAALSSSTASRSAATPHSSASASPPSPAPAPTGAAMLALASAAARPHAGSKERSVERTVASKASVSSLGAAVVGAGSIGASGSSAATALLDSPRHVPSGAPLTGMERRHSGRYVHHYPAADGPSAGGCCGHYVCATCHVPLLSARRKLPSLGGYATFSDYFAHSADLSVVVPMLGDAFEGSFVGLRCVNCGAFFGRLLDEQSAATTATATETATSAETAGDGGGMGDDGDANDDGDDDGGPDDDTFGLSAGGGFGSIGGGPRRSSKPSATVAFGGGRRGSQHVAPSDVIQVNSCAILYSRAPPPPGFDEEVLPADPVASILMNRRRLPAAPTAALGIGRGVGAGAAGRALPLPPPFASDSDSDGSDSDGGAAGSDEDPEADDDLWSAMRRKGKAE